MTEKRPIENRPIRSYGELRPGGDRHPYLSPRALRINASMHRQRLLQVLAASCLLLAGALLVAVGALVLSKGEQQITPYLVRIDGDGAVVAVDTPEEATRPTRAMVHHALVEFLNNSRTVTTDRAAQRQLILRTYAYATGRAVGVLNDFYRKSPPFSRASRTTVTPKLTSLLRLSERDVYQLQWTEEVRNLNGALVAEERWRALLTVTVEAPEALSEALVNPLGIKVSDLDWTPLTSHPNDSWSATP